MRGFVPFQASNACDARSGMNAALHSSVIAPDRLGLFRAKRGELTALFCQRVLAKQALDSLPRSCPNPRQLITKASADTSRHCVILVKNCMTMTSTARLQMIRNLFWPGEVRSWRTTDVNPLKLHETKDNIPILVGAPCIGSFKVRPAFLVSLNQPPTSVLTTFNRNFQSTSASGSY